ncbi:TolC family protein [Ectothiorhodospira marina]|uniref:Outer membrane protein TolC n=1 Tax=Ectothiorhodospira marina TaxID=1396821 RepID=A0A1H7ILQ0_9GAMM|nr:TolC family protein [Ectothiorhodospira marina]SEK62647.1 Outer membrane protein TolC [Ectothiorhodospira marina]
MQPQRMIRALGPLVCLALMLPVQPPIQANELPRPLTLVDALEQASPTHPRLIQGQARQRSAEADRALAGSRDDLEIGLQLTPRWIEPNDRAPIDRHDDSRALLQARKTLYDFGRTRHQQAAAETTLRGETLTLTDTRAQRRLEIMRGYFQVLLADLTYARDNEAMAVEFVELNRLRERHALEQISDIDLMARENRYQAARIQRHASLQRTRAARQQLALILGYPDDIPDRLRQPDLPGNDRDLPDLEALWNIAGHHNPQLRALRLEVEAAGQRVAAQRAEGRPLLHAEAEAGWWSREFGGDRNPLALGLVLDIPLYSGGRVDAATAREQAQRLEARGDLAEAEYALRQDVLETWQRIQHLTTRREQAQVHADYRDLYLDRSRSLYEMEVATDLGDAMTRQSEALLLTAEIEFLLALAWERLALLTGQPGFSPLESSLPALTGIDHE